MATISIIILLALFFYLFYFSERKTLREIMARPIIGLTTITIGSILFLVTDYNGRYYGLNPIIFNPVRLPQDVSIMIDRDNNLYITGKDELEILGPGFRAVGTHALVEDQGIETYRLDKGELFCKTEEINNANWRTHLIENYKIYFFIRIMSIIIFLRGVNLYVLGLCRK